MFRKYKNLIVLGLVVLCSVMSFTFLGAGPVLADADDMLTGGTGNEVQEVTGLGNTDIRIVIANIIRVVLGFMGIIAVVLIMYAGWLWTSSAGDVSKIEMAKKTITAALVGLTIILSSFGIVTFIINQLYDATGAGGGTVVVPPGGVVPPSGPAGATSCDGNILTAMCDADDTMCPSDFYCDAASACTCQPLAGFGDPCDADTATASCEADSNMCIAGLKCDDVVGSPTICTCIGAPIISWVSPVGGFCNDDVNMSCKDDTDCVTGTCNTETPNGSIGNLMSIGGNFFGATPGSVIFAGVDTDSDGEELGDADDRVAALASTANPECTSSWTEGQVIVVIPVGVVNGPIAVVRASDGELDTTNNVRGTMIDDYVLTIISRPGLCLVENDTTNVGNICFGAACGYFEENFDVHGISFDGIHSLYFGEKGAETLADYPSAWTDTSVNGEIPNIAGGMNSVFVIVDGEYSNFLNFNIYEGVSDVPIIDYMDPDRGPVGQYVTIYGSGFGTYLAGTSLVEMTNQGTGVVYTADGFDFPVECSGKWWRDTHITVKLPPTLMGQFGMYDVTVTNSSSKVSEPEDFEVIMGNPGPGVCLIDPGNGPVGQLVNMYGDHFGSVQGTGFVRFYNNTDVLVYSSWINQEVNVDVPSGAETGPVVVSNGAQLSNSVPFTVGFCAADTDCFGGEQCCPTGTYWSGICRASGTCSTGGPTISGYGWTFSTGGSAADPLTCGGYGNTVSCSAAGLCPNSFGQCMTRTDNSLEIDCDDIGCNVKNPSCGGNCAYSLTRKKCIAASAPLIVTCDEQSVINLTDSFGVSANYDIECTPTAVNGVWQFDNAGGSCPTGSYYDINGLCTVGSVGAASACSTCDDGFDCETGECVIGSKVCPPGSSCTAGECELDNSTCECCCEVTPAVGASDCCYGLTCMPGDCGDPVDVAENSGAGDGVEDFGLCGGCRVELDANTTDVSVGEQVESNKACNCMGTSGKICRIDVPGDVTDRGVCVDVTTCGVTGEGTDAGGAVCSAIGDCSASTQYCDLADCFCKSYVSCDIDNNPLNGCSATATCGSDQFCDDSDCFCKPSKRCDDNNDNSDGCGMPTACNSSEYCDSDCFCQPLTSCDNDGDLTVCGAPTNCDASTQYCDPSDCFCKKNPVLPGDPCDTDPGPAVFCNPFACGIGYDCISDAPCGNCCCNLDNAGTAADSCRSIGTNLTCAPDSDSSSSCHDSNVSAGKNFGICCGCDVDTDCVPGGNIPETIGCSMDTCCRARPAINTTEPSDDALGICRNGLVRVMFDQEMKKSSFRDNIIVIGDFGSETCKAGTRYLAINDIDIQNNSLFGSLMAKTMGAFQKVFNPAVAYTSPNALRNYCIIDGNVSGSSDASGNGILNFAPKELMDESRMYYVIVKGDTNLMDDNSEGVLSDFEIGMNTFSFGSPSGALDVDKTFNGVFFPNAYVWSFTVGSEICVIDHLEIDPSSYLFQRANDDKVFTVTPKSVTDQTVVPIGGVYDWEWSWDSDNTNVATVTTSDNPVQTVTSKNLADAKTTIGATAYITADIVSEPTTIDTGITAKADVYLFLCENPWPPVVAGVWSPWSDAASNCSVTAGGCASSYNYEFYYCRDSGNYGTYDDLPAVVSGSTIIRGASLKCSDGIGSCKDNIPYVGVAGEACEGYAAPTIPEDPRCVNEILKEAYFFREAVPEAVTALNALNDGEGNKLDASWGMITTDVSIVGYKLYWGSASETYSDFANIDTLGGSDNDKVVCSLLPGPVVDCELLDIDNATYYLNLTSYYSTGAESSYYGEVNVAVKDTVGPAVPAGFTITPANEMIGINWVKVAGAVSYKLYYGTVDNIAAPTDSARIYGSSADIGDNAHAVLTGLANGTEYYYAVKAVDAAGNESSFTPELSGIPSSMATFTVGLDQVVLVWDVGTSSGGGTFEVYYEVLGDLD